jgi:hypothetical protein
MVHGISKIEEIHEADIFLSQRGKNGLFWQMNVMEQACVYVVLNKRQHRKVAAARDVSRRRETVLSYENCASGLQKHSCFTRRLIDRLLTDRQTK